jgi:ribonuclease E
MAAKKTTDDKTGEIQVKATAGAWWKTAVVETGESENKEAKTVGTAEETDEKRAPARGRGRKRPAKDLEVETLVSTQNTESQENPPVDKPKRRRSPKKKTGDTPAIINEIQPATEQFPKESDVPSPSATANVADANGGSLPTLEEQAPVAKARRKRPPRKKRPHKDQAVANITETGEVDTTVEIAEPAHSDEKTQEQPASIERKKGAGRSRSRRGKRSQHKEEKKGDSQEETTSSAELEGGSEQPLDEMREKSRHRDRDIERGNRFDEEEAEDAPFFDDDEEDFIPDDEPAPESTHKPVRKLLINAEEPEECRLALLEDGRLESIHVSTVTRTQTRNNIYKAKIVATEPNLQAAFVDYGTEKNGFLPFSEIHPEYFKQDLSNEVRRLVEAQNWKKLSITDVVEKGQEVLVQVVKEEVGKKGANMTTYLSLPGRCVVLMPGSDSSGISRKISGEERRSQLREAMNAIDVPEGIGWIVRTASVDITEELLARDVSYLVNLWDEIKKKGQELDGVGLVYEDQDSVLRFLREHFDPSIEEILVDDRTALEQVKAFVEMLPVKQKTVKVRLHKGSRPIFNQYSIEDQIESIYQSKVNLPSGGSIVIDPTEALVAIDVNSGSTSKGKNFEASIFQANMEAASELARQLRLRDLGGLVVVDFIDMRSKKHIRDVERQVKLAMKRDKAKVDISRISKFGLMQISRQKLGAPIEAGNYRVCEHCKGRGMVRSVETLALFYLRRIQTGASRKNVMKVECHFPLDVAHYLLNNKRPELQDMETKYHTEITIVAKTTMKPADNEIIFHKVEKEAAGKNQT